MMFDNWYLLFVVAHEGATLLVHHRKLVNAASLIVKGGLVLVSTGQRLALHS